MSKWFATWQELEAAHPGVVERLAPEERERLRYHLEMQAQRDYRTEMAVLAVELGKAMHVGRGPQPEA